MQIWRPTLDHIIIFVLPRKTCPADVHDPSAPQIRCSAAQTQQRRMLLTSCSSLSSAWPVPSASSPLRECFCTRPMQHLCQHLQLSKALIFFFFFLIAAELSWSCAEEPNVHTHPLSRGGEEGEVTAEGSLTPVSNWEIWITLGKLCWHTHTFLLYTLISFESDTYKSPSNHPLSSVLKCCVFKCHFVASAIKISRNCIVVWLYIASKYLLSISSMKA